MTRNNTEYVLVKNIKIRKLIIRGRNIRFDLNSFTLFVKEIIVEGENIIIYSSKENPGRITNIFEIPNGEIMKILSEVRVLCKDLNVLISKRCHIPPIAVLFITNTQNFTLNNINMNTHGTGLKIDEESCNDISILNGHFSVSKGNGIEMG